MDKNRETWIDCLKVVSAFLIVMQHSLTSAWMNGDIMSGGWVTVNAMMTLAKEGVPLFFMCSGYGMLSKARSTKGCLKAAGRLLWLYAIWMCLFGIYAFAGSFAIDHSFMHAVAAFVKTLLFGHYHVWFIFALIGLYLLTPLLYPVMQDKKSARYMIILAFIATMIIPVIMGMSGIGRFEYTLLSFDISALCGDIFYYLCGFYLGRYLTIPEEEKRGKAAGILIFITVLFYAAINVLTVIYDRAAGGVSGIFFDDKRIPGCFFVCLIFVLFKLLSPAEDGKGIWRTCAGVGFAVYMMHPFFIEIGLGFFKADATDIIKGIVIYMLCLVIGLILYRFSATRKIFMTAPWSGRG
ncbi:MAG: acyltransferase family protein [Lachnospiraceae bacterium]|nr:acyltransferase family protein [Lachnospiraceae bacterium]